MSTTTKKVYEYYQIKNGKQYKTIVKHELKGLVKAETINKFINENHDDILKLEPRFRTTYVVNGLLNKNNYQITKPTALKYLREHNIGTRLVQKSGSKKLIQSNKIK